MGSVSSCFKYVFFIPITKIQEIINESVNLFIKDFKRVEVPNKEVRYSP